MTMSWIITNWKRKTEDGHCQNRKHWRDPQDSFCPMGSKFHKGLYSECIRTFKNILNITADAGCNNHWLINPPLVLISEETRRSDWISQIIYRSITRIMLGSVESHTRIVTLAISIFPTKHNPQACGKIIKTVK